MRKILLTAALAVSFVVPSFASNGLADDNFPVNLTNVQFVTAATGNSKQPLADASALAVQNLYTFYGQCVARIGKPAHGMKGALVTPGIAKGSFLHAVDQAKDSNALNAMQANAIKALFNK
jgi:hypothetical protein